MIRRTRGKPGSPKGVPKPTRHVLDAKFHERLNTAMEEYRSGGIEVPELSRIVGCERATLHNYLKAGKTTIDVHLLIGLADALRVTPAWLLLSRGPMRPTPPPKPLEAVQTRALDVLKTLSPKEQEYWINQGLDLSKLSSK